MLRRVNRHLVLVAHVHNIAAPILGLPNTFVS
jgi:hypothetical protein